mmetsp:Transcript_3486/g.4673  ORF Transcript_3486/g.4673 Transcript_3486/m.4673 type:complete len:231 (-) Transcript_3486:65-757(-)
MFRMLNGSLFQISMILSKVWLHFIAVKDFVSGSNRVEANSKIVRLGHFSVGLHLLSVLFHVFSSKLGDFTNTLPHISFLWLDHSVRNNLIYSLFCNYFISILRPLLLRLNHQFPFFIHSVRLLSQKSFFRIFIQEGRTSNVKSSLNTCGNFIDILTSRARRANSFILYELFRDSKIFVLLVSAFPMFQANSEDGRTRLLHSALMQKRRRTSFNSSSKIKHIDLQRPDVVS